MAPVSPLIGFLQASHYIERSDPRNDLTAVARASLDFDKRDLDTSPLPATELQSRNANSSPLTAYKTLTARDSSSTFKPGAGAKPASEFNNAGFLALFAILGAAMVIASIWFFFWAKNGGFKYQEGDWEDYKSTVLRRKGPDGKTLSNATKSTKLGGGSSIAGTQHFKWQQQAARSVIGRDEKGRKGITAKRGWAKTHSILYDDDYMTESFGTNTVSDMTEIRSEADFNGHGKRYRDRDVADYKREKPARVGGLNRIADGNGSHFASTVSGSETMSETSEQPILNSTRNQQREKERAERKAKEEATRMERRWKREAEEAAAALARENAIHPPPPPPAHSTHRKSAAPSSKPGAGASKPRHTSRSRSNSPQKKSQPTGGHRDFSYQSGPASEVLSTAYTGSTSQTGTRTAASASYYDRYRPANTASDFSASERGERRSRQSSPRKGGAGGAGRKAGRTRDGGYRRGADSDLD
ncbi:hypothetical protein KC327_g12916 [Hortaea werneckii]|nr:hypothetical protein KC350_g16225 [Hortaea werneckii]KAI6820697.1 hypothetical protein KC358_g9353 [Hortaea werneckii]KAI6916535.1 hypothetical protein KC348_g11519 [Hortaea werneckii]KAI6928493.1 hypothetical protein KC341_g11482 [Hortaea werneckii]KAI6962947.1 hypothetical protein KC321_g11484 [Hortaea werneckii]